MGSPPLRGEIEGVLRGREGLSLTLATLATFATKIKKTLRLAMFLIVSATYVAAGQWGGGAVVSISSPVRTRIYILGNSRPTF